jgi:hypothetical protein
VRTVPADKRCQMELYFVLDEYGEPVRERDVHAWSRWFAQADRSIARSAVAPNVTVLTTFSGVYDVATPDSTPKLFESRVFGGILDGEVIRHCTRAEAMARHAELLEWCRIGALPNAGITEADIT